MYLCISCHVVYSFLPHFYWFFELFTSNLLQGPESQELAAASRLEDDVSFYQTASPDVAKLFHIDPKAKRPALVMLKKEDEKISLFGLFHHTYLKLRCLGST